MFKIFDVEQIFKMLRLQVSCEVRLIYTSLGTKGLIFETVIVLLKANIDFQAASMDTRVLQIDMP